MRHDANAAYVDQKYAAGTLGADVQAAPPVPTPDLVYLTRRFEEAVSEAEGITSVTSQALDRLHGPVPAEARAIETTKTVPDVVTYALEHHLARLNSVLSEMRSIRDRINSLV